MKRKLSHIIFAAAALLAAVSCSKEEAPVIPLHLTVSTYEVSFDAAGGNQQIDYCYSGDWTDHEDIEHHRRGKHHRKSEGGGNHPQRDA